MRTSHRLHVALRLAMIGVSTIWIGLAMLVGPIPSALRGIPAGQLTERPRARRRLAFGGVKFAVVTELISTKPILFELAGFVCLFQRRCVSRSFQA